MSKQELRKGSGIPRLDIAMVCGAVVFAVVFKLLLTRGQLLPGLDGAYYWVQVRSLLERSRLAFDDLPLVFWLQAAVAKALGNVKLAVRLSDAVFPALSAIPIFMMTRISRFQFVPALSALVVLLHPTQLYFFTGDFIKNESAIPVVFFIGYILMNWDSTKNRKISCFMLAMSIAILSITHFGTLLLGLIIVGMWSFAQLMRRNSRDFAIGFSISLIVVFGVSALLAVLVPSRFDRLRDFVLSPTSAFRVPVWKVLVRGDLQPVVIASLIIGQIGTILLGIVLWKNRHEMALNHVAVVIPNLVIAFVLSSPVIGMQWALRLSALSFVSLSIAGLVLVATLKNKGALRFITCAGLLILACSASFISGQSKGPVLEGAIYKDFQSLIAEVDLPDNSVVIARHGLEFLIAWELRTDVVPGDLAQESDLSDYSNVFLLVEKTGKTVSSENEDKAADSPVPKDERSSSGQSQSKDPGGNKSVDPNDGVNQNSNEIVVIYENQSFVLVQMRL